MKAINGAVRVIKSPIFRQALGALAVLSTGTALSAFFTFITQVILARLVPISVFGQLAALTAAINFLGPIGVAGASGLLLQAFGRELRNAGRWLVPCLSLASLCTVLSTIGLVVYMYHRDVLLLDAPSLVIYSAVGIMLGQEAADIVAVKYQVTSRFNMLTIWQVAPQACRLLVILILALLWVQDGAAVIIGYGAVGYAITGVGVFVLVGWMRSFSGLQLPVPTLRASAHESAPFALLVALIYLYYQGVIVPLDWWLGGAEAAGYSAANMVIAAVSLIPHIIYQKLLLAKLYRWGEHDLDKYEAAFHVGVLLMGGMGLVLCLVSYTMASWIIGTLFGPEFVGAISVLRVLSLSLPFRFVCQCVSSHFISKQAVQMKSAYLAWATVANLTSCLLIVPHAGAIGAAIASCIADAILLVLHVRGMTRHVQGIDASRALRVSVILQSARRLLRAPT